jgi:hypothetical protein
LPVFAYYAAEVSRLQAAEIKLYEILRDEEEGFHYSGTLPHIPQQWRLQLHHYKGLNTHR